MNTIDRVEEIRLQAIPARLKDGAYIMGRLWRGYSAQLMAPMNEKQVEDPPKRCATGWSAICRCADPTPFCKAKIKWVGLLKEYSVIDPDLQEILKVLSPASEAALLYAMRVSEFESTLMTIYVKPPIEEPGLQAVPFGAGLRLAPSIAAKVSWPSFYKDGELDVRFKDNKIDSIRIYRLLNMKDGFRVDAWKAVQEFMEFLEVIPVIDPAKGEVLA
jgi:hypothetical protein